MELKQTSLESLAKIAIGEHKVTIDNKEVNLLRRGYQEIRELAEDLQLEKYDPYAGLTGVTRSQYLNKQLEKINGTKKIKEFILYLLNVDNNEGELHEITNLLKRNNYAITATGTSYQINSTEEFTTDTPKEYNIENLKEFMNNIPTLIKANDTIHHWEAVGQSKTAVEIVLKYILLQHNITPQNNDSLSSLFTKVEDVLGFKEVKEDKNFPKEIKSMLNFSKTAVESISNLRNNASTGHAPKFKMERHWAKFTFDQSTAIINFLIATMELQLEQKKGN